MRVIGQSLPFGMRFGHGDPPLISIESPDQIHEYLIHLIVFQKYPQISSYLFCIDIRVLDFSISSDTLQVSHP